MFENRQAEHHVDELEREIGRLWSGLELGPAAPLLRKPRGDGSTYVEFRDGGYQIAVEERGQEYWRECGLDLGTAARFFLFQMAVHHAGQEELRQRQEVGGYSRWNWMAPAIALMQRLTPQYGVWAAEHYAQALDRAPLTPDEFMFTRWPLPPSE